MITKFEQNFTFCELSARAILTGYAPLSLDINNDVSLNLLSDGKTAVVFCRNNGELARFPRETYFSGGYWSDVDIDHAINYAEC